MNNIFHDIQQLIHRSSEINALVLPNNPIKACTTLLDIPGYCSFHSIKAMKSKNTLTMKTGTITRTKAMIGINTLYTS